MSARITVTLTEEELAMITVCLMLINSPEAKTLRQELQDARMCAK